MEIPLVSIVIPTCDRPELLANCLGLLTPQLPQNGVEVLVCDDGKSSETARMIAERFPSVSWHKGPSRGPAANRNFGARSAGGKWIIFLDDDCQPRDGYLEAFLRQIYAHQDELLMLEGATFSEDPMPSLFYEAPHNPTGGKLISCNFATPRALFVEMNGFDERYPMAAFEDTEFYARVLALGIETGFVERAAVEHPVRRIPIAKTLAKRWEARVIYAFDLGATRWDVVRLLPSHVFKIICSRIRDSRLNIRSLRAIGVFGMEFMWVLWLFPTWISRWYTRPRSEFWSSRLRSTSIPRNFGF